MLSTLTLFCFSDSDILAAVQSDQLEILKLFLEAREDKNPVIDVNPDDGEEGSVLLIAATLGHLNIIVYYKDILQFTDINPKNNYGFTPLFYASLQGHLDVVDYYEKNGYKASSKIYIF